MNDPLLAFGKPWDKSIVPSHMRFLIKEVDWDTIANALMEIMSMSYEREYTLKGADVRSAWETEADR